MLDPNTATVDELRDWLFLEQNHGDHSVKVIHNPIPATLDAAAAAMPKRWLWMRMTDEDDPESRTIWRGYRDTTDPLQYAWATVLDTGDEIRDRFALAVACRIAQGAHP